jgi:hypothetical protein
MAGPPLFVLFSIYPVLTGEGKRKRENGATANARMRGTMFGRRDNLP